MILDEELVSGHVQRIPGLVPEKDSPSPPITLIVSQRNSCQIKLHAGSGKTLIPSIMNGFLHNGNDGAIPSCLILKQLAVS